MDYIFLVYYIVIHNFNQFEKQLFMKYKRWRTWLFFSLPALQNTSVQ